MIGHSCTTGADIDSPQRPGHGGDRLHRSPHPDELTGGHAAFGATRTLREPLDSGAARGNLVVGLAAANPGKLESVPHLHTLDRLDAHQSSSQLGVQPAVALNMAAQTGRAAPGNDLDNST